MHHWDHTTKTLSVGLRKGVERSTSTYTGYMIVYASQGVGGTVGKDRAVRPRQPEGVSLRVPGFTPP